MDVSLAIGMTVVESRRVSFRERREDSQSGFLSILSCTRSASLYSRHVDLKLKIGKSHGDIQPAHLQK